MVISALFNGENSTLFQGPVACNGNDLVVALLTARRMWLLFDSIPLPKVHSAAAVRTTAVFIDATSIGPMNKIHVGFVKAWRTFGAVSSACCTAAIFVRPHSITINL